ncbi:MAG: hypothetical protein FLDDKLPJ_00186 [Phycisphaerae bacterium]|nr:hypothetical protein [Phycisphaerae bacterium]
MAGNSAQEARPGHDDDDDCPSGDQCVDGLCEDCPGECCDNADCDDGNPCTQDKCRRGECQNPCKPDCALCNVESGGGAGYCVECACTYAACVLDVRTKTERHGVAPRSSAAGCCQRRRRTQGSGRNRRAVPSGGLRRRFAFEQATCSSLLLYLLLKNEDTIRDTYNSIIYRTGVAESGARRAMCYG